MVSEGLIAISEVEVIRYTHRAADVTAVRQRFRPAKEREPTQLGNRTHFLHRHMTMQRPDLQ